MSTEYKFPKIIITALLFLLLSMNCSKKESTKTEAQAEPLQNIDSNNYHSKIMLDGKLWMTNNLNITIPESFCHDDKEINCATYGRLYTWEGAKEACKMLSNGWRLPTNEEWQIMAKQYGEIVDNSENKGKAAYANLIEGGKAEFNAVLGGNREPNGDYARLGAHGFYWTSTEYDSASAWFYNFGKGSLLLNRHTGEKARAVSVRCIQDSEN